MLENLIEDTKKDFKTLVCIIEQMVELKLIVKTHCTTAISLFSILN